jgi:hypothetical protein
MWNVPESKRWWMDVVASASRTPAVAGQGEWIER